MRKICYISGTRADFGLMKIALQSINLDDELNLKVIVTGMHLLSEYGDTHLEILDAGLKVLGKVKVDLSGESGAQMSIALGQQVIGITKLLAKHSPDIVLLLGDRGEMLAGAIAALHLNIAIVHIHGGELSGTIDEPIRHAISKLSHYHFAATEPSKQRLIKMGEAADNVFVTGAPGLDELVNLARVPREVLFKKYGLEPQNQFILLIFHPVVQQAKQAAQQMRTIIDAILKFDTQILILRPNADAGSLQISGVIDSYLTNNNIKIVKHIHRNDYLLLLAEAIILAGNSSSGIIEAASLNTPVLNIGERQNNRERNNNVVDVSINSTEIHRGLIKLYKMQNMSFTNIYGQGMTANKITELLKDISLHPKIMEKSNSY